MIAAGREEFAGAVILLTVGLAAVETGGRADALGPSVASRFGVTFGLPMAATFRKELGEILAAFWATGSPRSRVLRETAVKAPGFVA